MRDEVRISENVQMSVNNPSFITAFAHVSHCGVRNCCDVREKAAVGSECDTLCLRSWWTVGVEVCATAHGKTTQLRAQGR